MLKKAYCPDTGEKSKGASKDIEPSKPTCRFITLQPGIQGF